MYHAYCDCKTKKMKEILNGKKRKRNMHFKDDISFQVMFKVHLKDCHEDKNIYAYHHIDLSSSLIDYLQ